jgi:hypothetical protein
MIDLIAGAEWEVDSQPDSRRPWSLWEMLDNYAWWFFILAEFLTGLHRELGLPPPPVFAPPQGIAGLGGIGGGFGSLGDLLSPPNNNSGNPLALPMPSSVVTPPNTLTNAESRRIVTTPGWVDSACHGIGLTSITKDIDRAKRDTEGLFPDRQKIRFHIEHITERVVDELAEQLFLHISPDKAKYYRKSELFSEVIGAKFPKAREDLTNAGTAYALGLNTAACVFHLMRVLEHCVQRFGRRLKITDIDVKRQTWHQIMLHVHKKVEALPGGTKATVAQSNRKQSFAVAASRLDHVRIAWRNDVMHPKATYDEKEALDVLTSVGAFLESIVKLV